MPHDELVVSPPLPALTGLVAERVADEMMWVLAVWLHGLGRRAPWAPSRRGPGQRSSGIRSSH